MRMALSEHLPRIAAAPDGIQKLRGLILELAVRGKLVPQDPNDEPASKLLKEMATECQQLESSGVYRKAKSLPVVTDEEISFDLPTGWSWIRLGQVGNWGAGATPSRSNTKYYGGSIPWFKSGELTADFISDSEESVTDLALKECSLRNNQPGDVLIAMYGATIGKTAILSTSGTTNQAVCACTPYSGLFNRYLLNLLKALKANFIGQGAGGAQPNISREKIVATVAALPPLAEQHRIVAKVDELMALCDRLESEQTNSAAAHAQLVETLLCTLTQSTDAADFEANWKRIAEHFDTLFTTEASIDALQKATLQLAVIGKLTSQDSTDESASDLLARIRSRHKTTKTKTQNPTDIILPSLPGSWSWSKLEFLITLMDSGWSPTCIPTPSPNSQTWGVLKTTAVQTLKFIESENKELPEHLTPRPDCEVAKGDILITRAGPQNRVAISCLVESTRPKLMISDKIIRFHLTDNGMHDKFVALCLNAGVTAAYLESAKSGMAASQMNITQEKLKAAPIPICSHNEQVRIVAKVDALMSACESLKAKLAAAEREQSALADTLIKRVLAA